MAHTSVQLPFPCEFIEITPVNPLISKCTIKVCYVGETPNRNRSIITKEVATEMAQSLPGSPIVGYFDESIQDFLGHERELDIVDGEIIVKDITKPYGFVDLNAKVWFQKFLDDGVNEREYLVTEGWLWTSQYPECQRIITQGNNHSMELDEETLQGNWTKDENQSPRFFIINEALISKLCILGEETEPCFEGASIKFSLDEEFKTEFKMMVSEITELLNEGGKTVFRTCNIEVGSEQWNGTMSIIPADYKLHGYFEEVENEEVVKAYTVVTDATGAFFNLLEDGTMEALENFEEAAQYSEEELSSYKADEDEDEEEEICPDCRKPVSQCVCKHSYSIEEYEALNALYEAEKAEKMALCEELDELRAFKHSIDKQAKQAMIDQFYMVSDADKADIIANIDQYSVDEIESKLAVICVRNKLSFETEIEKEEGIKAPTATVYNLEPEYDNVPAWVKSARQVASNM